MQIGCMAMCACIQELLVRCVLKGKGGPYSEGA